MDKKLIIMAAGASSRMKRSLETSELTPETKKIASSAHKSLIPLGFKQKPLLFHLIQNAVNAGFKEVYLITSPENEANVIKGIMDGGAKSAYKVDIADGVRVI